MRACLAASILHAVLSHRHPASLNRRSKASDLVLTVHPSCLGVLPPTFSGATTVMPSDRDAPHKLQDCLTA